MIERVSLENVGPFTKAEIRLEPGITVLVGPNGSGKSTLLQSLAGRVSQRIGARRSAVTVDQRSNKGEVQRLRDDAAREALGAAVLQLDASSARRANAPKAASQLSRSGHNLTNVIASLGRRRQEDLARAFCALVPTFADIDVVPHDGAGHLTLRFQDRWNPDTWYSPGQVSDGTILTLAWLSLAYADTPRALVGIEEIENGIHPYLIRQLMGVLAKIALGPPTIQFVIATHSPLVLDCVPATAIRFFTREDTTGEVQITEAPTDRATWPDYLATFDDRVGEAWLSGGLGGVGGG